MHLNHPAEVLAALRAGKAKLLTGWTQGCCARDSNGREVALDSPEACFWCVFGSVWVKDDSVRAETMCMLNSLAHGNVILWHEAPGRTAEEVIELVDKAIALCEQQCLVG